MAVKGFNVGGNIHQYDANSLANIADITDRIDAVEDGLSDITNGYSKLRYATGSFTTSSLADQGDLQVTVPCPAEFNGGVCLLLLTRNGTYFTSMGATISDGSAGCWIRNVSGVTRSVTVGYVALMFA